jgi:predicted dienelactone hydrolase
MAGPRNVRTVPQIVKGFAVLLAIAAFGLMALLMALWLEHRTPVTLPAPTGPFAVGRTIVVWTDDATVDTLAPVQGTRRELVVWMWYPADASESVVREAYLPAALRAEIERARGTLINTFLTRDLSKVHGYSIRNSEVSPKQRSYPVLIMRAGASSEVVNYSTLAEDLTSHGYVVVGFDAPYRTNVVVFPDGRAIRRAPENNPERCLRQDGDEQVRCVNRVQAAWTADIAFLLDRLQQLNTSDASGRFNGRLDTTRIGVFGHSFGGATAAQFCHQDPRCTAGINIDGAPHGSVIHAGIDRPFMFLLSDHGNASDPVSRRILANIQSIYDRLPVDTRLRLAIRGANHFTFRDDGALLKSQIVQRLLRTLGLRRLDGRRQLAVTAYCVRSFFDAYLKGPRVARLEISAPLYPEIEVLE